MIQKRPLSGLQSSSAPPFAASRNGERLRPSPSVFDGLPPLSPVLAKLMQALMKDDVSIIEVGTLVRSDLALSSQVLRLVNSPMFALRREITGILEAISLIGLDRVKALSFTMAMQSYLTSGLRSPIVRSAWRHSLATALIAEKLGAETSFGRDMTYTSGLFHEIGLLLLLSVYPKDGERMVKRVEQGEIGLLDAEKEAFGLDHFTLGAMVIDRWRLPVHLKEVMKGDDSCLESPRLSTPALVEVSCRMADYLGFSVVMRPQPSTPEEILNLLPERSRYRFEIDQTALTSHIAAAINSIELNGSM